MEEKNEFKNIKKALLYDASDPEYIYEGGLSEGILQRVRPIKLCCIDDIKGDMKRCCSLLWGLIAIISVLYTLSTYGTETIVAKPETPCVNTLLGQSILHLPLNRSDASYDFNYGRLFEFEIKKNESGLVQIFMDG